MKKNISLLLIFMLIFTLNGCGSVKVDEKNSPVIETVELISKNSGKEDTQRVQVALFFDKNVKLNSKKLDCLDIRIAGKRIRKEEFDIEVSDNAKRVNISIPTTMVTTANIEISVNNKFDSMEAFTDESGKYACESFKVEGIIPCGVILQEVKDNNNPIKNTIQVVSPFSIRSIGWLQLVDNGKPVISNLAPDFERMGDAVALHGHEFLRDGRSQVAENIVDVITRYFGDNYTAVADEDIITISKNDDPEANLDLKFFTYTKLNGVEQVMKGAMKDTSKMEKDREPSDAEMGLISAMHISNSEDSTGNGKYLYDTVTITGRGIGEEQNYNVHDLESIACQSFESQFFNELGLVINKNGYTGISLTDLILLGRSEDAKEINYVKIKSSLDEKVYEGDKIIGKDKAVLAFIKDGKPITTADGNGLDLVLTDGTVIEDVKSVICDDNKNPENPHYAMHHLNERFSSSNDLSFEVNIVKNDNIVKSGTMTTKELEMYALSHEDEIVKAYYGVSGIKDEYEVFGAGGWLDYFEGVRLKDLITYLVEDIPENGELVFYDRDGRDYAHIEDMSYLNQEGNEEEYYCLDREGIVIPYSEPILAYGKNGYPLLAKHDHESPDYINQNMFAEKLASMGIFIEEGVVKNHNGPFVAGLGNFENKYGGNQKETGAACVRIDILCGESTPHHL